MTTQPVTVNAFRSHLIVATICVGSARYKVFQVFFGHDGSLFVSFPYFRHRIGILAAATSPGNGQNTSNVDLQVGGKIASHDVKYSHHPDGRAHFSQTGKVRTEIKRQSTPLNTYRGHMFSVLIQGVEGFDRANERKDFGTSPKRTTLAFEVENSVVPEAVKFAGFWYELSTLPLGANPPSMVGPQFNAITPAGKHQNGFLVASPYDNARHVLFIACEPIPRLGAEPETLIFYGGFDPRETMDDVTRAAGFLAFVYPAANGDELKAKLGTIDLSQ